MRALLNKYYYRNYSQIEWVFMKFSMAYLWLSAIFLVMRKFQSVPMPVGLCKWLPCHLMLEFPLQKVVLYLSVIIAWLYILEIKMLWTTLSMFIISMLVFTIEESNGILERRGLLTFIFVAQFVAYLMSVFNEKSNVKQNRVQFSVQVVAAGYVLAGLSKLFQSGLGWVTDGPKIVLQILKSHYYTYVDLGNEKWLIKGNQIVDFINNNTELLIVLLFFSLLIELLAFLAIFSKKHTIIYGFLLLSMHVGIYVVLEIAIVSIIFPMLIFMINPLYIGWLISESFFRKIFYR